MLQVSGGMLSYLKTNWILLPMTMSENKYSSLKKIEWIKSLMCLAHALKNNSEHKKWDQSSCFDNLRTKKQTLKTKILEIKKTKKS